MKKYIPGLAILFLVIPGLSAAVNSTTRTTPLCSRCHQPEANMIRGVLKGVSLRAHTMSLDLLDGREETVNFRQNTLLSNIASLGEIERYKGDGFRIFFIDEGSNRQALHIARFDPMSALEADKRLGVKDLEKMLSQPIMPTLVDLRPAELFQSSHIPGAINIPSARLKEPNTRLPSETDLELIVYGNDIGNVAEAALFIMSQGYRQVRIFAEDFSRWEKTHYTVCSMSYARKQNRRGSFFVHLREELDNRAITARLPIDLEVTLASLETVPKNLPERLDTPIIVYGPGQDQAAATIKAMGYRQVRVLNSAALPWAERMAANGDEACY
jgi:rhodanese-related sulfurtransferase